MGSGRVNWIRRMYRLGITLVIGTLVIGGALACQHRRTGQEITPSNPGPKPTPGQPNVSPSKAIQLLQFVDERHGWLVRDGAVMRTVNGGAVLGRELCW